MPEFFHALADAKTYALFEQEFSAMDIITPPRPRFADVAARIKERAASL